MCADGTFTFSDYLHSENDGALYDDVYDGVVCGEADVEPCAEASGTPPVSPVVGIRGVEASGGDSSPSVVASVDVGASNSSDASDVSRLVQPPPTALRGSSVVEPLVPLEVRVLSLDDEGDSLGRGKRVKAPSTRLRGFVTHSVV